MQSANGAVRIPMNVEPPALGQQLSRQPVQHVALACSDALALARAANERGLQVLDVPDNYYGDIAARFDLPPAFVEQLKSLGLFYDRGPTGEYLHFYTRTVGNLFWEFVERRDAYDGYGAANAPVRLTAQSSNPPGLL